MNNTHYRVAIKFTTATEDMTPFQRGFCAINAVSVIIIVTLCCSTGLLRLLPVTISDDVSYTLWSHPPSPVLSLKRANPDEPCQSSVSYDHLTVLPHHTQPIKADTEWICNLYRTVKQFKERQLTLLVCNKDYLHVLINWLSHAILYAHYPANGILVIAFDSFTHEVMQNKGFHSVYVLPEDVTNIKQTNGIWVTRVTITRLLSYWNYSVLEFDSDAIMIKNIQPILNKFNNSDIIASAGKFPENLSKKWKAPTLCMGVILIKSSPATG